jgi:hypothetical protein
MILALKIVYFAILFLIIRVKIDLKIQVETRKSAIIFYNIIKKEKVA